MSNNTRLTQLFDLLKEQPEDGFLLFAVAKEYENIGDFPKAIEYYEKLRKSDPEYVGLYYHLADQYKEMEDYEKALFIFNEGIKIAQQIKDLHALSELRSAKMNMEMEMD